MHRGRSLLSRSVVSVLNAPNTCCQKNLRRLATICQTGTAFFSGRGDGFGPPRGGSPEFFFARGRFAQWVVFGSYLFRCEEVMFSAIAGVLLITFVLFITVWAVGRATLGQ